MTRNKHPTDGPSTDRRLLITAAATLGVAVGLMVVGALVFPRGPLATVWALVTLAGVVGMAFASHHASAYVRRECGCLLDPRQYGFETVDTEYEWRRSRDGEKVRWEQYRTELRRCEQCGDHYHTEVGEPEKTREMWPEDEAEQRPDSTDLDPALEV